MSKQNQINGDVDKQVMQMNGEVNQGRRRMLAAIGVAGVTMAFGGLIPGGGNKAKAHQAEQEDMNVYNVKYYGAVGDGVTDDAAAIQSAINAVNSNGGGTLYFPVEGEYMIGSPIVLKSNVVLAATGRKKAKIKLLSTYAPSVDNTNLFAVKDVEHVGFCNLSIDLSNVAAVNYGFYISNCTDILLERLEVMNSTQNGKLLVRALDSVDIIIRECVFRTGSIGIDLYRSISRALIDRCDLSYISSTAIRVLGTATLNSEYVTVRDCKVHHIGGQATDIGYPIYFTCGGDTGGHTNKHRYAKVLNCEVIGNQKAFGDGGTADQIAMYDVDDAIVHGNISLYGGDVGISTDRSNKLIISNNIAAYCHTIGIFIYETNNVTVAGNEVYNNYQNYNGTLNPNMDRGGINISAGLNKTSSHISITGNRCYDDQAAKTQEYGIYADNRARSVDIGTNSLEGNKLGMIRTNTDGITNPNIGFSFTVTRDGQPTSGYWEKGMVVRSRNVATGNIKERICVVSGTPGTWQPEQAGVNSTITSTPNYLGQMSINSGDAYIATGTSSSSDWKKIT